MDGEFEFKSSCLTDVWTTYKLLVYRGSETVILLSTKVA